MPMQIVTATGSPVYFVNTDGWPNFEAMARVCGLSITGTMQVGAAVRMVTPPDVIRPTTITMAEVLASQISKKEAQALASAWRAGDLALGLKTEICRVLELRARGRWTNGQHYDPDPNIEASADLHRRCAERRGTQLGALAYLVEVLGTKHRVRMHEIMPMDIAIHPQSGRSVYIEASAPAFRGHLPDEDEASRGWTLHYIAPTTDNDAQGAIGGSISGSGDEWFTVLRLATLREPPIPRHPDHAPTDPALGWRCATCWCLNLGPPGDAPGGACKGCGSTTRERAIYNKHVTEGVVPESEQTTMSRYTYEEDDGSRITIRDGDATVSIVAGVPMSEIDPGEEEAVVVLNPTPEKAREIARWLELYAKAVEAAR